jgi:hypothetical protein
MLLNITPMAYAEDEAKAPTNSVYNPEMYHFLCVKKHFAEPIPNIPIAVIVVDTTNKFTANSLKIYGITSIRIKNILRGIKPNKLNATRVTKDSNIGLQV